ncbi:hypothetical protein [Massilia agri]|uniref:Uncharacterized protein n=1 Tax=Massilia agri TaxID=1886785 RepID=A0ABT2AKZ7_9BURK|nr:hypothetical protein [Massilia agri]MCS0596890.1 hypothetical protein [Massilia agri]
MTLRDCLGLLLFAAGVVSGMLAYSLRDLLLGVCAAALMTLGLGLVHWRKRERECVDLAYDELGGPRPWRLWPRRETDGVGDDPGLDGCDGD